jgi:hypothetical protein
VKPINGYCLIKPEDLSGRPSNAGFLERTGGEILGARLRKLPPESAKRRHGANANRRGNAITVPKHGGVLVAPKRLRQVFNDADEEVLWLIVGAPAKNSKKRAARHESIFQKTTAERTRRRSLAATRENRSQRTAVRDRSVPHFVRYAGLPQHGRPQRCDEPRNLRAHLLLQW